MRLDIITDDDALHALGPAWAALWRRAPGATPFQSPAWMLSWWRCFGTGRPVMAVLRDGAELSGLLACYLLDEPAGRKLLPIGAGLTDYQDALLGPGCDSGTATKLLHGVLAQARSQGAKVCDLIDLPSGAALRSVRAPNGWRDEAYMTDPCPLLTLTHLPTPPAGEEEFVGCGSPSPRGSGPGGGGALREIVPAGKLRDLRQSLHRADRIGGWNTEVATAATLDALLDALLRLHASRWRSGDQPGVVADPRVARFHRLAAPALLGAGTLRLQVLRFGRQIAAAYYTLLAGSDRTLFYLSGFDPAFARASPGTILLAHMIEQAIAEGRRELHFLRGGEAYKYAWGASDRMNATRRLVPL